MNHFATCEFAKSFAKKDKSLFDEKQRQKSITLKMRTCKHFTGIHQKVCELGIKYESVFDYPPEAKEDPKELGLQIPCTSGKYCRTVCYKREFPTLDEATAEEERIERKLNEYLEAIQNGLCPNHKIKVTKKQVGSCVYAEECGCRLYQGKA